MNTRNQNLDSEADALIASLQSPQTAAQPQGQFPQAAPVSQLSVGDAMPFAGAPVLTGQQPAQQPITSLPGQAPMQQPAAVVQSDPMLMQTMQNMNMQMQKMQQVIQQLGSAQSQGQDVAPQADQASTMLESLKAQLDGIPDEYEDTAQIKAVMLSGFEALANQMQTVQPAQVQPSEQPALGGNDDGHGGQLIAAHPDLMQIASDPYFTLWAQQDTTRDQIRLAGNTPQSIQLLTDYKQYKQVLAQQQAQGMALQNAQPSHAAAIAPDNNGGALPAQVSENNLDAILNQDDKYGTKFAESEADIDALLSSLQSS